MDITGYEDRTYGFNAISTAFGVERKAVRPWWCYSNPLHPFTWNEIEQYWWNIGDPCMDAPDLLPSGGMKGLYLGGRNVIVCSRENLKTPFEMAVDAEFQD